MLRHACGYALANRARPPGDFRDGRSSLDHEHGSLYGLCAEQVRFLAGVSGMSLDGDRHEEPLQRGRWIWREVSKVCLASPLCPVPS